MTGFKSKRAAALDEEGMYLVHQTAQKPVEDVMLYHDDGTYIVRIAAQRPWVGLTDEEIGRRTILAGFNPEWKIEIGMVFSIVRNLEAKLKERNA